MSKAGCNHHLLCPALWNNDSQKVDEEQSDFSQYCALYILLYTIYIYNSVWEKKKLVLLAVFWQAERGKKKTKPKPEPNQKYDQAGRD